MKLLGTYSPINPGESEVFGIDFTKAALQPGDAIDTVAWTLTIAPGANMGTDPGAQSHITGPPTQAGMISSQRIAGTLPYCVYIVLATATTVMGDTKKLWGYLLSFPPGAILPTLPG